MLNNVVIGAGPAGIGAGLSLGDDGLILEKSDRVGGFSGSIEINGAFFDFGGHSFHTPHPEVRKLVYDSLDMYEQTRNAKCYVEGESIPYPFQKNFRKLTNKQVVLNCIDSMPKLKGRGDRSSFETFEEFILQSFGEGIAKHFMLPYNRKLWGRDLRRMAADWTSERVAGPEGTREKFDTTGGKRKPLQSDTKVGYPARGGFGEIYNALGRKLKHVEFHCEVFAIDPKAKKVFARNGMVYPYQNLISTMPIADLLPIINGTPGHPNR